MAWSQAGKGWVERGSLKLDRTRADWGFREGPSFQREEAEATVGNPVQPHGSLLPGSLQIPEMRPEQQGPFLRAAQRVVLGAEGKVGSPPHPRLELGATSSNPAPVLPWLLCCI